MAFITHNYVLCYECDRICLPGRECEITEEGMPPSARRCIPCNLVHRQISLLEAILANVQRLQKLEEDK